MSEDVSRQIANLGKGLVQINLRLNRISEQLEDRAPQAAGGSSLELLLDLLEAIDRTLETRLPAPPLPWWQRMLGASPPPTVELTGLTVARDQVVEALAREGITPVADQGPTDPRVHRIIDTRPTGDPALNGHIATTHQRGWASASAVLRLAHVTAWRHTENP